MPNSLQVRRLLAGRVTAESDSAVTVALPARVVIPTWRSAERGRR